jgi:hypothetical protein
MHPNTTPITNIKGITKAGLAPLLSNAADAVVVKAIIPAHRQINAAGEDDQSHANRNQQETAIVNEQVKKRLWSLHGGIHLAANIVSQEKNCYGGQKGPYCNRKGLIRCTMSRSFPIRILLMSLLNLA